ncbi:MAG: hypothetical protein E7425_12750 [Ruminococcaceae bacterium]|jgi:hypothetical protein|nr:hypothetical protein [Oscillospiraceae bacterium]
MRLFRRNMEKRCAYCTSGSVLNEREVACPYRGIVGTADHCRRFVYDPLKRVPPRPAVLSGGKYSEEDFQL